MEAHLTIHTSQTSAAAMASHLRGSGFQVALAGPLDPTFLRNDDSSNDTNPLAGERWIVLATKSGLIMLD